MDENIVLRVGIAGYGVVGKRRHHFMKKNSHLRVVAVCDRVFSTDCILEDGVKAYSEYKDLLKENLDILYVCLPNYISPETTIAGLEKGLHVFCEKPPGRNIDDIVRVIRCEKKHPKLVLKYGFNHRYHDSIMDALKLVRSGELGEIVNIRGVYGKSKIISFQSDWRTRFSEAGGGILLDQGIHMVDLMRLFAGEFTEVKSFISNDFWKHDVEDNAYAIMRTDAGVIAMLHSTATQWRHRFELEIALSRGSIILSGILSGSKSYGAETLTVAYVSDDGSGDPKEIKTSYNRDHSWKDEIDEFTDAVLGKGEIRNGSSYDALKTMSLVYKIYCADSDWQTKHQLDDTIPEDIL